MKNVVLSGREDDTTVCWSFDKYYILDITYYILHFMYVDIYRVFIYCQK